MLSASEKTNVINWLSAGFNIYGPYDLQQSVLPRMIFDPRKAPTKTDPVFGDLPVYMAYQPESGTQSFEAVGEGRDSFQSKFATRAGVDVSVGAFSGHVEAAFGEQVAQSSQYSYGNISFISSSGAFVIHGLGETKYLTDEFAARLAALPMEATDENLTDFADFFQDFGAYFISRIQVGATLEYYVAVKQSDSMKATQISAKMNAEYNSLFVSGKASAEMSSDEEWKSYRKSKVASIRIKGGADKARNALANLDAGSMSSMSETTAANYKSWLDTLQDQVAVMNFKLTGIWEVCGAKRKAVEDAFRKYGTMMRPKLRVETRTLVDGRDGYVPSVFLGGRLVQLDPVQYQGWGGYRLLVIDRCQPSVEGVRMNKLYSVPSGDASQYQQVFDTMYNDLKELQNGGFVANRHFFVLATFGALNSFPPTPKFAEQMKEAGAGPKLQNWLESAGGKIGTVSITDDVNYILIGIMQSGPGAGVEGVRLFPMSITPRVPHTSSVDVYFYSLGAGKPYVLGASEVRV